MCDNTGFDMDGHIYHYTCHEGCTLSSQLKFGKHLILVNIFRFLKIFQRIVGKYSLMLYELVTCGIGCIVWQPIERIIISSYYSPSNIGEITVNIKQAWQKLREKFRNLQIEDYTRTFITIVSAILTCSCPQKSTPHTLIGLGIISIFNLFFCYRTPLCFVMVNQKRGCQDPSQHREISQKM